MGWRAFVSLSEGKISICSLTASSSVQALPLWPPRRRGSGHSWWSGHRLQTCVWWRARWKYCVFLASTFSFQWDNQLHLSGATAVYMCRIFCAPGNVSRKKTHKHDWDSGFWDGSKLCRPEPCMFAGLSNYPHLYNRAAAPFVPPLQLHILRPVFISPSPHTQLCHLSVLQHVGRQLCPRLQAVTVFPNHRLAVRPHVVLHHSQLDVLSQVAAHQLPSTDYYLEKRSFNNQHKSQKSLLPVTL